MPFLRTVVAIWNGRCHFSERSLPLKTVDAISHDGRCHRKGRCQEGTDISDSLRRHAWQSEQCVTSFPTNHRDFYQIKMADKPNNFLKDLISSAIKEVESKRKSFESTQITKESFLASLPDDSFYYLKAISGNGEKFKVHFLTEDITKENLEQWISEYEVINSISVKWWCTCARTYGFFHGFR